MGRRRRWKIREKRKTKQARVDKLKAMEYKSSMQRSYSMKTIASESSYATTRTEKITQPPRPDERFKWNLPADPERTAEGIRIPPSAKFF